MICGFIPWEDFGVTISTAGGVWDEAGVVGHHAVERPAHRQPHL